jgi:hypothetical protein
MLLSQIYWFYYDSVRQFATPSPVPGDTLFLLAHVFFCRHWHCGPIPQAPAAICEYGDWISRC